MSERAPLPADAVPIVPMRTVAVFPGTVMPITLGRDPSIAAAQEAVRAGHKIGLLAQRHSSRERPTAAVTPAALRAGRNGCGATSLIDTLTASARARLRGAGIRRSGS